MPLGTVALSPLELATAYGAFAGLGEAAVPRLVLRVEDERGREVFAAGAPEVARLMDPGVAFLVTNVLEEALARGTGTAVRGAGFSAPAAGKTGTTNDATDAWFVGYTPQTVAAAWIGFDEPRPIMAAATGGRLAAPVWGRMMRKATEGRPVPERWRRPENVVQAWVDADTGVPLAAECREDYDAYRELFLRGTLPEAGCPDHGRSLLARILRWLPSDEDDPVHDPWPEDLSGGSEPPPPPEYEEAERWRRRQRREAQRRAEEWAERMEQIRQEMEERRREARKAEERRREQWEKEEKRRRQERVRRRRDREG
jgi:membrane peptidoglycan carboxypeptidase